MKKSVLTKVAYDHDSLDAEMAFCKELRKNNVFMHVINLNDYGHLVNGDNYNTLLTRPDFYMMLSNRLDWEQRYIHADYAEQLKPNSTLLQVS